MEKPRFRCIRVREVKLPHRANSGDAGLDFYFPTKLKVSDLLAVESNRHLEYVNTHPQENQITASTDQEGNIVELFIGPKTRVSIPSGIKALLEPKASMMQGNNKSGRSTKQGITVTANICDSPYVGEYHLCVMNHDWKAQKLEADKAIEQFIHIPIYLTEPEEISHEEFDNLQKDWGTRADKGMGNASKNN